ncbi:MAG: DUF4428 domain-containing protein [Lachnospiraceae bacterium]|nr:DUF4428 domain-containing protein [Lachnospiraceae bacterium]
MGLFDKKYCDVCGEKIGLLGNRKLADGNLCKDCAGKLSPWFSDRRQSTIEEIKEQLNYREQNKDAVANFNVTKTFGNGHCVFIDEFARNFMIGYTGRLDKDNPDVVSLDAITGVEIEQVEHKKEVYQKDAEGKDVSYNPKRYAFSYDIKLLIHVNNPYFDEMTYQVNTFSIDTGVPPMLQGVQTSQPMYNMNFKEQWMKAEEIKAALLAKEEVITETAEETAPAPAPAPAAEPVTCPGCGATVLPDEKGKCPYCRSQLI